MIAIKNKTRRMLVLNLDRSDHVKVRKIPVVRQLINGGSVGEFVKKRLADSLTILARATVSNLPDSVGECTEVKNAEAAGQIQIIRGAIVDRSQREANNPAPPAPSKTDTKKRARGGRKGSEAKSNVEG